MSKPKILLAESSSIVLQIEKRYLQDSDAVLFTASDSDETLKIARKVLPNLIYLSYNLHGMGGISCCKSLKADPKLSGVPVVMVCNTSSEEALFSRDAGCDAVVGKPVDKREFLETGLSLISETELEAERMLCRAVVACTIGAETFYGAIEDISISGMFVGSVREVAPGDRLFLKFFLPRNGSNLIECEAQVNWVNSGKRQRKDLPAGFGVLFQEMEPNAIEQIRGYMKITKLQLGW